MSHQVNEDSRGCENDYYGTGNKNVDARNEIITTEAESVEGPGTLGHDLNHELADLQVDDHGGEVNHGPASEENPQDEIITTEAESVEGPGTLGHDLNHELADLQVDDHGGEVNHDGGEVNHGPALEENPQDEIPDVASAERDFMVNWNHDENASKKSSETDSEEYETAKEGGSDSSTSSETESDEYVTANEGDGPYEHDYHPQANESDSGYVSSGDSDGRPEDENYHAQVPAQIHGHDLPLLEAGPNNPTVIISPPTTPVCDVALPLPDPSTSSNADSVYVCDDSDDAQVDENHYLQAPPQIQVNDLPPLLEADSNNAEPVCDINALPYQDTSSSTSSDTDAQEDEEHQPQFNFAQFKELFRKAL